MWFPNRMLVSAPLKGKTTDSQIKGLCICLSQKVARGAKEMWHGEGKMQNQTQIFEHYILWDLLSVFY